MPPESRKTTMQGTMKNRGKSGAKSSPSKKATTPARIPLYDFLHGGRVLSWPSSKPGRRYLISYDDEDERLFVTFVGGSGGEYAFGRITEDEARSCYFAPSKGKWFWTYLRVRGSATAHQKPYWKLS